MRKDIFKNRCENDMTANDLNVGNTYKPKSRGKFKMILRRNARNRLKQQLEKF